MPLPTLPINQIVSDYRAAFDWLHEATSRQIVVIVHPTQSGCPNHSGYDPLTKSAGRIYNASNPFSTGTTVIASLGISGSLNQSFESGTICPVCEGNGFLYSPTSGTASARIQWRNKETQYEHEKIKLMGEDYSVRIKVTGAADIDLLDRAKIVQIDGKDCRIIKSRVPVGLRDIHTYYYYLNAIS